MTSSRNIPKNIKLMALFNFFLSFRFYYAVLIIYFVRVTGSYTLAASIFSIIMLSSAVSEVPTGVFSDYFGRKGTLVLGAFFTLISTILYASADTYTLLVVGGILQGISTALYSGNNQAIIHDSLTSQQRIEDYSEFYGKVYSAEHLGLVIAAIIGGVIASYSFSITMWLSVIPAIIGFFISLFVVEPILDKNSDGNIYSHLKVAVKQFKQNAKLRRLSISSIIGYGQGEAGYQFRPAFIETLWPIWAVGIAHALSNVGATLSYYFSGKVIRRFGALEVLIGGKLYALISNIVAFIYPTVLSPAILATNSLFHGSGTTARSSLMQDEYTSEQRSTMESLNSLGGAIFFAFVSFGLGLVSDEISPARALLILQVLAGISLYVLWKMFVEDSSK